MNSAVLIPVYNNVRTIRDVASRAILQGLPVIVVDDGSTDGSGASLEGLEITLLTHKKNLGKGMALKTGFEYARKAGYGRVVTLDGDGQHYPEDIPLLEEASALEPRALVVGSRDLPSLHLSKGSAFANRFSNFWFKVQTLRSLPDTQTGLRSYPLERLPGIFSARDEAELALLVFSAWKGIPLVPVPIRVLYPEDRVSSFKPVRDFSRISLLNVCLCLLAVVYGYPRMLLGKICGR